MAGWYLLFVNDERSVVLFRELPTLVAYVDAQDVKEGLYKVFASNGQEFSLLVDRSWNVKIEPGAYDPEKLRRLIVDFHDNEVPSLRPDLSLPALISELQGICRVINR